MFSTNTINLRASLVKMFSDNESQLKKSSRIDKFFVVSESKSHYYNMKGEHTNLQLEQIAIQTLKDQKRSKYSFLTDKNGSVVNTQLGIVGRIYTRFAKED